MPLKTYGRPLVAVALLFAGYVVLRQISVTTSVAGRRRDLEDAASLGRSVASATDDGGLTGRQARCCSANGSVCYTPDELMQVRDRRQRGRESSAGRQPRQPSPSVVAVAGGRRPTGLELGRRV